MEFNPFFIKAPAELLRRAEAEEGIPKPLIDGCMWIWPECITRVHITKSFVLENTPEYAEAKFVCDNKFSLFLNGYEYESQYNGSYYTLYCDTVAKRFSEGKNYLAIRAFQSGNPMVINAAIAGGVSIKDSHGNFISVATDESWQSRIVCGFYKANEPEGWATSDTVGKVKKTNASELHPRIKMRSVIFGKDFSVGAPVKNAKIIMCAKGLYEACINGQFITEDKFVTGVMDDALEYREYDITHLLGEKNTLSVTVASGWLNSVSWGSCSCEAPAFAAEIRITYKNGSEEIIATDESFWSVKSPLVDNDLQYGERYDARLEELLGDRKNQYPAELDKREIKRPIMKADYPAVRVREEMYAKSVKKIGDDTYLFDFGVNSSGRARLCLENTERGRRVEIRYTEYLDKDGLPEIGVYQDVYFPNDNNPGSEAEYCIRNIDVYICRGAEYEEYAPRFAYTGFRYIYVKGIGKEPSLNSVRKLEMNTDLEEVGDVESSLREFNIIWDVVKRSFRSNFFAGPTDCPTREKNYWNGDVQASVNTALWYLDAGSLLSRWTEYGRKIEYGVYGWEDEEYILPLALYKFYGDKSVIEAKYGKVLALIKKREAQCADKLPDGSRAPYCDHKAIENLPADFYAALYHIYMYKEAARMAEILGKDTDRKIFSERFSRYRAEFNEKYFEKETSDYTPHCQGGIVLPMAFGIAPEEKIASLAQTLYGYVKKSDYHFTTGFMSSEHILGILCDNGYTDAAYKIITGKSYPSLLDMISTGATTTTENWCGQRNTFKYDSMNHYAFGSFARWFFEHLGGIKIKEAGFEEINVIPTLIKELGGFSAKYRHSKGLIKSSWEYRDSEGVFVVRISVPKGISAYVSLPDGQRAKLDGGVREFVVKS